jgi:hypothetical protein
METILEVWKKKGKILEGIKNSFFKKKHVEEVAAARNAICQACPNIDRSGDKCFAPGTQPCCGICGCSLQFLQRSLSSKCEADKWQAVLTEEEADELQNKLDEDGNKI